MSSHAFPEAGSLALTMVALLLPISSLWAGMAIDQEASTLNLSHLSESDASRRVFDSIHDTHDSHGPLSNQLGRLTTQSSRPEFSANRKGSMAQLSPALIESGIGYIHSSTRDSTEIDLEAIGVRVIKSYDIQHES
jgi:pheromone alpha factor receptor